MANLINWEEPVEVFNKKPNNRFPALVSENDIIANIKNRTAAKTHGSNKWALNAWSKWQNWRNLEAGSSNGSVPELRDYCIEQLGLMTKLLK